MASYEDAWNDDEEGVRDSVYSLAPEDIVATARCLYSFDSTNDVELSMQVRKREPKVTQSQCFYRRVI